MTKNQKMWAVGFGVVAVAGYFYWNSKQPKATTPPAGAGSATTAAATTAKFTGSQTASPSKFN